MSDTNPTEEQFLTLQDAYSNALLYGIGIIKIMNTPRGPELSVVSHEEYFDLGEQMQRIAKNKIDFTDKPSKS